MNIAGGFVALGDYLVGSLPGIAGIAVATGCNGSMLSAAGGVGRLVAATVLDALGIPPTTSEEMGADDGGVAGLSGRHDTWDPLLEAFGRDRWDPRRFVDGDRWD